MNWQPGDRVRVKMAGDAGYHSGVIEKKADAVEMWWVIYSGSRPGYYPEPILHTAEDIEPLQ